MIRFIFAIILLFIVNTNGKLLSLRRSAKNNNEESSTLLESPTLLKAPYSRQTAIAVDSMNSIDEVREELAYFGNVLLNYSKTSLFFRAFVAGIFVGFGGILTASVGYDAGSPPWAAGNGFIRFMSGAIGFPLTILLISMTGCGAWTADALLG